jgi:hypothetical protein
MEMLFTKLPGGRHTIEVRGRKRPDIRLPARETGPTIPHDLAHAAVEQALGLVDGFWAAVERGAMFEGFELVQRGRNRRAGLKELKRYGDAAFPAELAVSWAHRVWSGQRVTGRGLGECPLNERQLARACAALDEARARWDALQDGETLVWQWESPG